MRFYGRPAQHLCCLPAIFYCCCLDLFSLPNLRGCLANRYWTLPHVWWWPGFMKFCQKFWWPLPLPRPKFGGQKQCDFRLDREYLWNITRYRQSENSVANSGHFRPGKLNLMYFGPQTAKNSTGVPTHPTRGHQAGHCHTCSCVFCVFYFVCFEFGCQYQCKWLPRTTHLKWAVMCLLRHKTTHSLLTHSSPVWNGLHRPAPAYYLTRTLVPVCIEINCG